MALDGSNIYQKEGPTGAIPASGGAKIMGTATDVTCARPDVSASALRAGFIVERHAVNVTRIRLAQDASVTVRGILVADQYRNVDGTYNYDQPIAFAYNGPARVYVGAALARDVIFCSDATGRARLFVAGVDDARAAIGKTKEGATAAGDAIDVIIESGG